MKPGRVKIAAAAAVAVAAMVVAAVIAVAVIVVTAAATVIAGKILQIQILATNGRFHLKMGVGKRPFSFAIN